ncbi:hypothetical protein [Brevibacillus dissolubilis]|uniref:hypothetical protein n=1 Tax=Brevibacillus dissolubilis TaxID=1844116 RepID=UPI00159BDDCE|nr:hypothetical protein [Brevibacillus dissolubilis]
MPKKEPATPDVLKASAQEEGSFAPGMEDDQLEASATQEEIARGDSTPYQALIRDYTE